MTTLDNTLMVHFTKDGERTITYIHGEDNLQFFKISGYPGGDNTITVQGAESMNYVMSLLANAGYDSNEVII